MDSFFFTPTLQHVRAHTGLQWNEMADRYAKMALHQNENRIEIYQQCHQNDKEWGDVQIEDTLRNIANGTGKIVNMDTRNSREKATMSRVAKFHVSGTINTLCQRCESEVETQEHL